MVLDGRTEVGAQPRHVPPLYTLSRLTVREIGEGDQAWQSNTKDIKLPFKNKLGSEKINRENIVRLVG